MLNNPLSQIERTQDAFAGNPEGLEKRANMSKELIDLLAMQALQSDLAAQKRNMAMQQQGNPQTVKDQLEEGLMGQYREEAAKDLGVGPSEGDVVERAGIAGQQMAQNAQMPQGPQGPQGGGGVASQAGPVKLAGGGIVAFDAGGDVRLSEYLTEKGIDRGEFEAMSPQQQKQIQKIADIGSGLGGFLGGLGGEKRPALEKFRRSQGFDTSPPDTPSAVVSRGNATKLDMQEEERKGRAGTTPPAQEVDTTGIASLPKVTGPTLEQQGKAVTERQEQYTQQRKDEAPAAASGIAGQSQNPYADQLATILGQDALTLPEYKPSEKLTKAIEALYSQRDPDAAAAKARELYRDTENRTANAEQLTRLDDMRTRDVASRNSFDVFSELLGGIASDGLGGAGKAGRAIETRRRESEQQYEQDRVVIQNARIKINETMGAEALDSFDKAETQNREDQRRIVTAIDGTDERTRASIIENVKLKSNQRGQNIAALVGLTRQQEIILNREEGEPLRNIEESAAAIEGILKMETAIVNLTAQSEQRYMDRLPESIKSKLAIGKTLEPEEQAAVNAAREEALIDVDYLATRREIIKRKETFQRLADATSTGAVSSSTAAGADIDAVVGT